MANVTIDAFAESVRHQTTHLRERSRNGEKILGYFCTYTPLELLHAAGFLPVRIMGEAQAVSDADNLAPQFRLSVHEIRFGKSHQRQVRLSRGHCPGIYVRCRMRVCEDLGVEHPRKDLPHGFAPLFGYP